MDRQLNAKQIKNLRVVLKFRYVTTDNLARQRNITQNSAYSALEILNTNGYLGKVHDKSYRLQNKSARYYLTHQALDYLRKVIKIDLDTGVWKSRTSDSKKSSEFIDQQVAIHAVHNELRALLPEGSHLRTAPEIYSVGDIIKPLPSLLVQTTKDKFFFVEVVDNQHLFIVRKRIRKYILNYDNNEWEWDKYPDVYIVRTSSASDRTRLCKYIEQKMDDAYLDEEDFSFYVVSSVKRINVS